jgi:chaperone BCS1
MICKDLKKRQSKGRTLTYTFSVGPRGYSEEGAWGQPYAAPSQPLATVDLEQHIKDDLIEDIARYLGPRTASFYKDNGIPWRRACL